MAEARREHDWSMASSLMALLANCHRDPKKPAFTADQFNPMRRVRRGIPMTKRNLASIGKAMGATRVSVRASDVRVATCVANATDNGPEDDAAAP